MTAWSQKDILSTRDLAPDQIETIFACAEDLMPIARKEKTSSLLEGKMLAALFYDPSTRTRLSFEAAMQRLGGRVLSAVGMEYSSLAKGETLADTARVIENYVDVIVMRHPQPGSVAELAAHAAVPVLNAGDGAGEHPTQALLDVFTIQQERKNIDGLTIAMVGDLKYGRTVHSLAYLLANYNVKLIFVAPQQLRMPGEVQEYLLAKKVAFEEMEDLEKALGQAQVVYDTRVQRERFKDVEEYEKLKHHYVLTRTLIEKYNPKMTILHPLPRFGELDPSCDAMPGAAYFRQVKNGMAVRMALLSLVLGKA